MLNRSLSFALLLIFTMAATAVTAQILPTNHWIDIETAILSNKNLEETLDKVNREKSEAKIRGNEVAFARYSYYTMLIRDKKTEDSLYFKNSAFIDSTLMAPGSSKLLKSVMHLLQARRINIFQNRYLRFKRSTYETQNQPFNYGAMTKEQRDSVIRFHLKAVRNNNQIPLKVNEDINWLSSSGDRLLFKPDLEDLALSERIVFEAKQGELKITSEQVKALINSNPAKFLAELSNLKNKQNSNLFAAYLLWMEKHKSNPEQLQYLQMLSKYFLFTQLQNDENISKVWQNFLKESLSSEYTMGRGTAAYHLFLIYFQEGSKYGVAFENKYKGQLTLAVRLSEQCKETINQFPGYRESIEKILRKIKSKQLNVSTQDTQLPETPILITAQYRNTTKIFYRIVKVGIREEISNNKKLRINTLLNKPAFRDSSFTTTSLTEDYDKHASYLKIDGLPFGTYHILFSINKRPETGDRGHIEELNFQVSNIAAINASDRFMVLNRKTGRPMKVSTINYNLNSKVVPVKRRGNFYKGEAQSIVVSNDQKAKKLLLVSGKDTLIHSFSHSTDHLPRSTYSKEEYDDLDDFYDEQASLHIYTDRSIYRPGQRVFYKVILLTKNPVDGMPVVFSNATNPYFKKWLEENKPQLSLEDPKRKTLDSIKLEPDAYGSFSGSFLIPKEALPGSWEINASHIDTQNETFKVEEYKRPSLEMTMEKPSESTMPGDPFELKLKVNSLSGADLKNVKIAYKVSKYSGRQLFGGNTKVIDSIGYTNEKGELVIRIKDTLNEESMKNKEQEFLLSYQLEATATEATGESVRLQDSYNCSSWPIKISLPLSSMLDRKDLSTLTITAKTEIASYKPDRIEVSVYKVMQVPDTLNKKEVDQWLYTKDNLTKWFPNLELNPDKREEKQLISKQEIMVDGNGKYEIDQKSFPAGRYELVATTRKSELISGQSEVRFSVFDSQDKTVPGNLKSFSYAPINGPKAGEKITYYSGSTGDSYATYSLTYYGKTNKGIGIKTLYSHLDQGKGLQVYNFKIPNDAMGQLILTKIYVLNNEFYKNEERFYLKAEVKEQPELIIEKYRKVLAPGAKETFSVSFKTTKENIAAQLMTVMYDAALDKLEPHYWGIPNRNNFDGYLNGIWNNSLNETVSSFSKHNLQIDDDLIGDGYLYSNNYLHQLRDKVPGLSIEGAPGSASGLSEVVVVGYNGMRGYSLNASTIAIRGNSSLSNDTNVALVIVDGVIYTGSRDKLNLASATEIMLLKGAEATGLYGAKAAEGVLIVSTKGKIVLPNATEEPQAVVRKDFNETAFFYPNVYADKDGLYTFSFTMPQTATAWNWKMFAHSQNGLFAYAERKLQTKLNLMVQPNMPRLLYQGDELFLKSRISNSDSTAMEIKLSCKIEDAVTGEDLTSKLLNQQTVKKLQLPARQTATEGFFFKVPEGQLNPLKIVTTVTGSGFADAEEHTIPILPKKIFVRQQNPLVFSKKDSLINPQKLPADAEVYGMSIHIDAKPQDALLNALPYLANYSYDCAEQTFNKLFALLTAHKLIKTDPNIRESYLIASKKIKPETSKPSDLPDELTEAAMPWLNLANQTEKQQRQLFKILDTLANKAKINSHLEKLYKMQNEDGGLPWFEDGRSNAWISNYLIRGFGKLKQEGWLAENHEKQEEFLGKIMAYADLNFMKERDANLYYAYARSSWKDLYKIAPPVLTQIKETIEKELKTLDKASLYDQSLWIAVASKYTSKNDPIYPKIESQRKQILQQAINDERNGLRWKEIADSDDLNHSGEETIAMLYDVFSQNQTVKNGLIKWILSTKQDHNWESTTGTAAAIDMIRESPDLKLSRSADSVLAKVNDQKLVVSNDIMNGTASQFIPLSKPINVNTHANHASTGGLTWYYFSAAANMETLNRTVKLSKKLYTFDRSKSTWIEVNPAIGVKVGDKVKILLTVETAKPLRFLQIEDKRAGAFEPLDAQSGQKYEDGIAYYNANRDSGRQMFIDFLPAGRSEFSYEVTVTQEGSFKNGSAVLQCLYNPGITAYSNSMVIVSKSNQ